MRTLFLIFPSKISLSDLEAILNHKYYANLTDDVLFITRNGEENSYGESVSIEVQDREEALSEWDEKLYNEIFSSSNEISVFWVRYIIISEPELLSSILEYLIDTSKLVFYANPGNLGNMTPIDFINHIR
jgi:hypothetical protein